MSDDLGPIELGLTDDADPVVLLPNGDQAATMAAVLRELPDLATPARATELALAVNHLAHANDYRVITDPAAFEQAFRARLAEEDPAAEWEEGKIRVSDFGVPDFADIKTPALSGTQLVFFAVDDFLGVPYRAEAQLPDAQPAYDPLPLTPVPAPARPAPEPDIAPLSKEEIAAQSGSPRSELEVE